MPAPIYDCATEGAVTVGVGANKTVIGVKAHANSGLMLVGFHVSTLGVSAAGVPGLVELGYCTFGANSPGTNSTSTTPRQRSGRSLTAGFTSGKNWTAEPTTITVFQERLLSPNSAVWEYDFLLAQEPDCALAEGFVIRTNFPATVDVRAMLKVSRI